MINAPVVALEPIEVVLKTKGSTLRYEYGMAKSIFERSGQHDLIGFLTMPEKAPPSCTLMRFLKRYEHLVQDTRPAIIGSAQREEGVDFPTVTPTQNILQNMKANSRE